MVIRRLWKAYFVVITDEGEEYSIGTFGYENQELDPTGFRQPTYLTIESDADPPGIPILLR